MYRIACIYNYRFYTMYKVFLVLVRLLQISQEIINFITGRLIN